MVIVFYIPNCNQDCNELDVFFFENSPEKSLFGHLQQTLDQENFLCTDPYTSKSNKFNIKSVYQIDFMPLSLSLSRYSIIKSNADTLLLLNHKTRWPKSHISLWMFRKWTLSENKVHNNSMTTVSFEKSFSKVLWVALIYQQQNGIQRIIIIAQYERTYTSEKKNVW